MSQPAWYDSPAEQHYWEVLHQKISQYDVTNSLGLSDTVGTLFRFYVPYLCVATYVSALFSLWVLRAKYLRPLPSTPVLRQLICLSVLMVVTGPCYVWTAHELGWYIHTDSAYSCFVLVWAHNFSLVATAWTVMWLVWERCVSLIYPSNGKPIMQRCWLVLATSLPLSVVGILCSGHRSTQLGHAYPVCNPWWNNEYTDIAFVSNWYLVAHFALIPALVMIVPLACLLVYQAKLKKSLRVQVDSLDRENGMILELRTRRKFKFVNSSFAIGVFYFLTIVPLGLFVILAPGRMTFDEAVGDPHNTSHAGSNYQVVGDWFKDGKLESRLTYQKIAALKRINDLIIRHNYIMSRYKDIANSVNSTSRHINMGRINNMGRNKNMRNMLGHNNMGSMGRNNNKGSMGKNTNMGSMGKSNNMGSIGKNTNMGSMGKNTNMGSMGKNTNMGSMDKKNNMGSMDQNNYKGSMDKNTNKGSMDKNTNKGSMDKNTNMGSMGNNTNMGNMGKTNNMGSMDKNNMMGSMDTDMSSVDSHNTVAKEGTQKGTHVDETPPTPPSDLSHLTDDEVAARINVILDKLNKADEKEGNFTLDPVEEERHRNEVMKLINEVIRRESERSEEPVDKMEETSHKLKAGKKEKVENLKQEIDLKDDSNSSTTGKQNETHQNETKGNVNDANYENTKEENHIASTKSTKMSRAQMQKHEDELMMLLNDILEEDSRRVPQPIRQGPYKRAQRSNEDKGQTLTDPRDSRTHSNSSNTDGLTNPTDTQTVYDAKEDLRSSNYTTEDTPIGGSDRGWLLDEIEEGKVEMSYIINVARSDEEAVMWCVAYTFWLMLVPLLMSTEVLFRREAVIRLVQVQRMLHMRRAGTYRELSDIRERWNARDTDGDVAEDIVHDFTYQTGANDGTITTQPGETIALKDMQPGKTNERGNTDGNSSLPIKSEELKPATCAAGNKEAQRSHEGQGQILTEPRGLKKPKAIKVNVKHAPLNLLNLAKSHESLEKMEFRPEVIALTQTMEEKEMSLAKGNTYITNKTTLMEKLKNRKNAKKIIEACQNQSDETTSSRDNLTKVSNEKLKVDTVQLTHKTPTVDKKKGQSTSSVVTEKTSTKKPVKDKQHKAHKVLGKSPHSTGTDGSPIALQPAHSSKSSGSNSRSPKPIKFSVPGPDRAMEGQSAAARRPATPSHMKISDRSPPPPMTSPLVTSQHGDPDLDLKVTRTPKGKHTKHFTSSVSPGVKASVAPEGGPGGVGEQPVQSPTTVWKMTGTPAVIEGTREEVTKLQSERKTEFGIDLPQNDNSAGVSLTAQNVEPLRVHGIGKFTTIDTRKSPNTPTSMRVSNDYKVSTGNTPENSGVASEVSEKVEPGFPDVSNVEMTNATRDVAPLIIKDARVEDVRDDAAVDDAITAEDSLRSPLNPTPFTQAAILQSSSPPLD